MLEQFTDEALRVVDLAKDEARSFRHSFVGTEHLLLGLICEHDSTAAQVLEQAGLNLEATREKVAEHLGPSSSTGESLELTPRANEVLELSVQESRRLGHEGVGPEHILLGLITQTEGHGFQVLTELGVDPGALRGHLLSVLGRQYVVGVPSPDEPPARRVPRPVLPAPSLSRHPVPIGTEWTATAVRAGRGPADFAKAYEALERLAAKVGIDVDDYRVRVESVQTDKGPGLRLALSHRLEERDLEQDDEPG